MRMSYSRTGTIVARRIQTDKLRAAGKFSNERLRLSLNLCCQPSWPTLAPRCIACVSRSNSTNPACCWSTDDRAAT